MRFKKKRSFTLLKVLSNGKVSDDKHLKSKTFSSWYRELFPLK